MVSYLHISDKHIDKIKAETWKDQSLWCLYETIQQNLTHPCKWDELTLQILTVVIPKNLCADMKARIYFSHLGTESCLRSTHECICWPGMSTEVKQYISGCEICRKLDTPSQPYKSLMSHELLTIDCYNNLGKIVRLPDTKGSITILKLKKPLCLLWNTWPMSINGPQFASKEFATFVRTLDFEHLTSSHQK